MNYAEWNGFKGGRWEKEINVAEFVRLNYRPYDGDEKFLAPATEATEKLWTKLQELQKEERAKGGVAADFAAKYRKLTGSDSDEVPPQAPFAYTAAQLLVHGLVAARGTKPAVTKSIAELKNFKTVLGPVSYGADREIVLPLFVKTFGPDGRNVLVDDKLWLMP